MCLAGERKVHKWSARSNDPTNRPQSTMTRTPTILPNPVKFVKKVSSVDFYLVAPLSEIVKCAHAERSRFATTKCSETCAVSALWGVFWHFDRFFCVPKLYFSDSFRYLSSWCSIRLLKEEAFRRVEKVWYCGKLKGRLKSVLWFRYKRFTMIGQSVGSMCLAFEALWKLRPHVFIDTTGFAFTYPVASLLFGCTVVCYTHYPTISTDMLQKVKDR